MAVFKLVWIYSFYLSLFLILSLQNTLFAQNHFTISEPLKNLGGIINTQSDEFSPALSPDGSFMVFNSKRESKYQNLYISYFDFKNKKWGEAALFTQLNSPYNDETPSLSRDGSLLIFSSDRDGSFEMPKDQFGRIKVSFDLYYSKRINGSWSSPRKIPGDVNTIHHERAPSISGDKKRIYYTMWRFGDISQTVLMQAEWQNGAFKFPKPLPALINAGFQELALIESENGNGFYFSSLRPGGLGGWDIYYVSFKDGRLGEVINLGAKVNSEANDAFLSRVDQLFFISSNRATGKGRFDIYSTFIFEDQDQFATRAIHFDFNSPAIQENSYPYLNALTNFLKENKTVKLEIIGHTDLHGSGEFNLKLSQERAESVKNYLTINGVQPSRLSTRGLGKSKPLVNQIGPEFDPQNRRTEFRLEK